MIITTYTITGVCGAGYKAPMSYNPNERCWIRAHLDDGRCSFGGLDEAESHLDDARADADVRDVRIEAVETEY